MPNFIKISTFPCESELPLSNIGVVEGVSLIRFQLLDELFLREESLVSAASNVALVDFNDCRRKKERKKFLIEERFRYQNTFPLP